MPPFPKPRTRFTPDLGLERRRLHAHKRKRGIPARSPGSLLIGSWNLANLGLQLRREVDLQLIATIAKWFDVLAVQECGADTGDLYQILHYMGPRYTAVMSHPSGNHERLAYLYDQRKLRVLEEVGHIHVPPAHLGKVRLPGSERQFTGFDRPPYLVGFEMGRLTIQLGNVHLYFGSDAQEDRERRALETAAIARWAKLWSKATYSGVRELMLLGDFNLPKDRRVGGNVVYSALTSKGLVLPGHSGQIGSSVSTDNRYDQVAMFPETSRRLLTGVGVFDFDQVVFKELWDRGDRKAFNAYVRYYLSDHRVMWVELDSETHSGKDLA